MKATRQFGRINTIAWSAFLLKASCAVVAGHVPEASWSFDEGPRLSITGYARYVEGVRGRALKCDGFTTRVTQSANASIDIASGFSVQAWIAPQEHSWNWKYPPRRPYCGRLRNVRPFAAFLRPFRIAEGKSEPLNSEAII